MAAAPDALETALAERVRHFLENCVYENARFLAERLVAHVRPFPAAPTPSRELLN